MNRHLDDARYHLGRTAYHVAAGIRDEAAPYEARVRHHLGRERPPEPTRGNRVQRYADRARSVLARRAE